MILLTPEEKRFIHISNAEIARGNGDKNWFDKVSRLILKGIVDNPGKGEKIILKWVLSAEKKGCTTVKEQILLAYANKRTTEDSDQKEVQDAE